MYKVDDIKYKLKSFKENLLKQPLQVPQMGFSDHTVQNRSHLSAQKEDEVVPATGEISLSDQEILESTEAIYFTENDIGRHELMRLVEGDGEELNVEKIIRTIGQLKCQQKVVSKRVLQLILEKRPSFNMEFQNITETEKIVQESVWIVSKARSYLNFAKRHLSTSNLEIIQAYKKRQTLLGLLDILLEIRLNTRKNSEIQSLLNNGKYSEAISHLLQNKNQSEKYDKFICTESLKRQVLVLLDHAEILLDKALLDITVKFDSNIYAELVFSYELLGKTHLAIDLLHMNFISAIHSEAFNAVKDNLDQHFEQKLLFDQMCESLKIEKLVSALAQLAKAFWKILVCYYQVQQWHQNYVASKLDHKASPFNKENFLDDEYMREKLKNGQTRIWSDIQAKICIFISTTKLSFLKYESFIQVLSIIKSWQRVGKEFCEDDSLKMMDAMKNQSVEFFKRYHITCLDEIQIFLENEVWIQVHSFTNVMQLSEFQKINKAIQRHMGKRKSRSASAVAPNSQSPSRSQHVPDDRSTNSQDESSLYGSSGYFIRYSENSSPFENLYDPKMIEEDVLAGLADDSDSSDSDGVDNSCEATSNDEKSQFPLTVNSTSLNILRVFGRYLKMCRLLYLISAHIIHSMTELLDLYFFSIYEMFGRDICVPGEALHSDDLNLTLMRISENVIAKVPSYRTLKQHENDLDDPEQLFGLAMRVNALESCDSIIHQLVFLQTYLDRLLESTKDCSEDIWCERLSLKDYIENIQKCAVDIRKPILTCVTSKAIDIHATINSINKVKWDVTHVKLQHNEYIDAINRGIQIFAMRLEEMPQPMPKEALWDSFAHVLTHVLVEAYSNAKKCSPAGRAMMQLDFTHFMSVLELLSQQKYPFHHQYVEQYLKAYYLGNFLEEFITTQKNYSTKHMIGLINCACNDKKFRSRLLSLLEPPPKD